jgi:hypothetical protein
MNSPFDNAGNAISTEDAIKAAEFAYALAKEKKVESAICGGLAMHLYGFTRATKDIDFIADGELELPVDKKLSFGGLAYKVELGGKQFEIDWIIRSDDKAELYQKALLNKIYTDKGLPILSPEWLVVIKHIAGRGKDHMDCVWLLRKDGLVDRKLIEKHLKDVMGKYAYWAIQDLNSLMLEADLLRAKDEAADK